MAIIYTTLRLSKDTVRDLKIIAAHTGDSMLRVAERLVAAEWTRLALPRPSHTLRAHDEVERGSGSRESPDVCARVETGTSSPVQQEPGVHW